MARSSIAQAVLLLVPSLASCAPSAERWEPHVVSLRYMRNEEVGALALAKTGPTLTIDPGDQLRLLSFDLQLLPTRRYSSGLVLTQVKELPPVPRSALAAEVQVVAMMRKWEATGACYDKRDEVLTEWQPVRPTPWQLRPLPHLWLIGEDWDEIRVDLRRRDKTGRESEAAYTINSIMLESGHARPQLQRTVRQNLFSRTIDSLRGERFCAGDVTLARPPPRRHPSAAPRAPAGRVITYVETWLAVALLAVGNVGIGRLLALWGLPRKFVGPQARRTALALLPLWFLGWLLLYHAHGIRLTFTQAAILALVFITSYQWNRTLYRPPRPREGWGARLNRQVQPVARIIRRHQWKLESSVDAKVLAKSGSLRFDGADYDLLVSAESDQAHALRRQADFLIARTASGEIDYDAECASRIRALARVLSGSGGEVGTVERVAFEHDLHDFDETSYQQLVWLGEALIHDRRPQAT